MEEKIFFDYFKGLGTQNTQQPSNEKNSNVIGVSMM